MPTTDKHIQQSSWIQINSKKSVAPLYTNYKWAEKEIRGAQVFHKILK